MSNIYWKMMLVIVVLICTFYAGWHTHTWYDGYVNQKAAVVRADNIAKSTSNIINFNQKLNKVKPNDKKDCFNQPLPTSLRRLR